MEETTSKKGKKSNDKSALPEIKTVSDRERALERAIAGIEKSFGKGAVMKLGDNSRKDNIQVVPTGSLGLDVALGVGGLPRGRIIEVFGPESSGKTTVALHSVAEVQKRGGICGYIDAEHALDPVYAKKLGVNIDELYISQPDDGEQALEIAEAMVRSCAIDLVIVDSVAALTPRAEIEGEMGDSHMGLQARLMSQALRKLTGVANKTNCTVIFINQLRDKIGGYGGGETTTGGRALKFYASVRIDIRRTETIKVGDNFIGNRTKVKVVKNKVAPPFKTADFDIMYGEGISRIGDILDLAAEIGIVNKSGAWYSFNETRLGQGRETAKKYLGENDNICVEIENSVRKHFELPDLASLNNQIRFLTNEEDVKELERPAKGKGKSKKEKAAAKEAVPEQDTASEEAEISEDDIVFVDEMAFNDGELKFEDD